MPLTLAAMEGLTANAYRELLRSLGPYTAYLDYDEAVARARVIAARDGVGFVARESCRGTPERTFSFEQFADIAYFPQVEADRLERFFGPEPPFQRQSLVGTPRGDLDVQLTDKTITPEDARRLTEMGFYRFDNVTPATSPWCLMYAEDKREMFQDYLGEGGWAVFEAVGRVCSADSEDVSEQGFHALWQRAQPYLTRVENPPRFRYDSGLGDGYFVCLDDVEYTAHEWEENESEYRSWAFLTERYVRVLDLALQRRGLPERCYVANLGNDTDVLFLTPEQRAFLIERGYLREGLR